MNVGDFAAGVFFGSSAGGEAGGVPFTQEEKDKLNAITNPMLIKGTVVDKEALEAIEGAQPGWVFFVGADGEEKAEYVRTEDGAWEFIGSGGLDTSEFVKRTDYATSTIPGLVMTGTIKNTGLFMSATSGIISLFHTTDDHIIGETDATFPLFTSSIPVFMHNYGITSKDLIPAMQEQINGLKIKRRTFSKAIDDNTKTVRLDEFKQTDTLILAIHTNDVSSSLNRLVARPFYNTQGSWGCRFDTTYGYFSEKQVITFDVYYVDMPVFDDGVSSGNSVLAEQSEAESKTESEDETS